MSADAPSHYDVLRVRPDATPEEVKRGYAALARRHHPDVGGDPAAFVALTRAHEVLSDPDLRAAYDRELAASEDRGAGGWSRPEGPSEPRGASAGAPRARRGPSFVAPPTPSWWDPEGWSGVEVEVRPPFYTRPRREWVAYAVLGAAVLAVGLLTVALEWPPLLAVLPLAVFALRDRVLRWRTMPPALDGLLTLRTVAALLLVASVLLTLRVREDLPFYLPAVLGAVVLTGALPLGRIASTRARARRVDAEVPRSLVLDRTAFGSPSLTAGAARETNAAERATLTALARLTEVPGVRALHGVPGSPLVLLRGRRVVVVHSRYAPPGGTRVDEYGHLVDEHGDTLPDGSLDGARRTHPRWESGVRGTEVASVVVLQSESGFVEPPPLRPGLNLVGGEWALEAVGAFLLDGPPVVDRRVLRDALRTGYPATG